MQSFSRAAVSSRSVKDRETSVRANLKVRPGKRNNSSEAARPSSNQKGAISKTVCGWHVRIFLRITVARKLLDFDFLRGLAPGRLDGFSIERYEKNCGSFDLYAAKFESGAMRFV